MPSIGESIKRLRKESGWTQQDLAKRINRSPQVVSNWERGYSSVDQNDIALLSDVFKVPTDVIMGKSGVVREANHYYSLTEKDERDIAKDLERIMEDLDSDNALAFHGEPLDDEDRELLKRSLENSLIVAKQLAKKKFTPKKYRK